MNVNVITRHAPANYGSLLQTIATQQILCKLGVTNQIINYIPKEETGARIAFTQLKGKKSWNRSPLKKAAYILGREPENLIMYHKFEKMRKQHLTMTRRFSELKELKAFASENDAVYMTGSDQVWGPISTGTYDPAYFLSFVPDDKKKIAYASSFGKASFSKPDIQEYQRLLSRYNGIAVRENSALDLIFDMGLKTQQVLDPTLLLSAEEWTKYIHEEDIPQEKYVLVYQIHSNSELDKYALKFAEKAGLPLVRVSPLLHQIKRGGRFEYLPDIGRFLALIQNASYLVTDSFHGTAFAINFNTQFVEVLPNTGTGSRNQSILELTGLQDRILQDKNKFDFVEKLIDFSCVNQLIYQERNQSLDVLKKMLSISSHLKCDDMKEEVIK